MNIPIRPGAIATLANGQPAWTRGGFVTQRLIDLHGGYKEARAAVGRGL